MPKMTLREAIAAGYKKPYWVQADRAVKNPDRVIAYSVWHFAEAGGREAVHVFSVSRKGGTQVALHLANAMRDDLNANVE